MFEIPLTIIGILTGGVIGYMTNPINKAKALRAITKQNYGIVNIRMKGKTIIRIIKNLDKDILRFNDGVYLLMNSAIYKVNEKGKLSNKQKINSTNVHFVANVPEIFIDSQNLMPLKLAKQEIINVSNQNPKQLESVLSKEIAINDVENLKLKKDKLQKYITIVAVISVISVIASILVFIQINNAHIPQLATKVNELLQLTKAR